MNRAGRWFSGLLLSIVALLSACGGSSAVAIRPTSTPKCGAGIDYSSVPLYPVEVPGPAANFATLTVGATYDPTKISTTPTTHIAVGGQAVVIITMNQGLPAEKTITVTAKWYFNGEDLGLPPSGTQKTLAGPSEKQVLSVSLRNLPQPGIGRVEVYADQPVSPATLVGSLTFGVYCQ